MSQDPLHTTARLYLCTDARRDRGDFEDFVDAAFAGGVDIIQLRDKSLEASEELELLEVLHTAAQRHGRLWAVNDRADIASLSGAPVFHVGQKDISLDAARGFLGKDAVVGLSTHSPKQVDAAIAAAPGRKGLDYFCVGPVWATPTKPGRAAVGLLPVAAGIMKVVGQDISAAKRNGRQLQEMRRHVGMVFQDPSSSLNPRLPIGESIGEPMFLSGVAKGAELQQRIEALLDQVELPRNYRNRYPHELSGGQKQRVGIARALSLKPKLMVADEPTSALDVSVQAKVLDLFQNLQKELGFACLFVTHDLAVVDVLADRICVMQRGRIVEQGTRDQILRNPQEPYTQRLLAAVPLPDPEKQRERRELRAQLLAAESS